MKASILVPTIAPFPSLSPSTLRVENDPFTKMVSQQASGNISKLNEFPKLKPIVASKKRQGSLTSRKLLEQEMGKDPFKASKVVLTQEESKYILMRHMY